MIYTRLEIGKIIATKKGSNFSIINKNIYFPTIDELYKKFNKILLFLL